MKSRDYDVILVTSQSS